MNARTAAAEILSAVTDNGRTLETALEQSRAFSLLDGRDRGFARALASAALRRLGSIDSALARHLARPLSQSPPPARALLRIGAAQLLVLKTPAHAAVGETVDAAKILAPKFAGLMNAVLRKVAAEGPGALDHAAPGADLPAWLYARWRAAYGDRQAAAIALALRAEPPLDLCVKINPEDWAQRLGAALTPTGALRLPMDHPPITELDGFATGDWWVQDAAAALPARLLGDVAGMAVLDLCAAPGGKTLQLAAAGARVTALDKDAERLKLLEQNLARTRLQADIVAADALHYKPDRLFDRILLDAPCTATGTLRRHPDIAWLRRPTDIAQLAALQAKLLAAAAAMLKPGGVLVYATCSLEPEEGPAIIDAALKSGLWRRDSLTPENLPAQSTEIAPFLNSDGDLRTLPAHWPEIGGMDGFYAARLRLARASGA